MLGYDDDFTKALKFLRAESGLTLRALSEKTGFSSPYLSDLENGGRPPTRNVIAKLSEAYNLDYDAQRVLYDASAAVTQSVPFDVQDYLLSHPEALQDVIARMHEDILKNGNSR